jgi:hypothetical protein
MQEHHCINFLGTPTKYQLNRKRKQDRCKSTTASVSTNTSKYWVQRLRKQDICRSIKASFLQTPSNVRYEHRQKQIQEHHFINFLGTPTKYKVKRKRKQDRCKSTTASISSNATKY